MLKGGGPAITGATWPVPTPTPTPIRTPFLLSIFLPPSLPSSQTSAKITHVQIRAIGGGKYDVGGGEQFADLGTLVKHYQDNPMVETNGAVVKMTEPFHATRVSAASIQARVAELSKETDEVFGRAGFYDEFEELQVGGR